MFRCVSRRVVWRGSCLGFNGVIPIDFSRFFLFFLLVVGSRFNLILGIEFIDDWLLAYGLAWSIGMLFSYLEWRNDLRYSWVAG